MKHLMKFLKRQGCPQQALAELAALAAIGEAVAETLGKTNLLAGSVVGLETLLEHHKLLTPEILKEITPKVKAKFEQGEPDPALTAGEPDPALAPISVDQPGPEQGSGQ